MFAAFYIRNGNKKDDDREMGRSIDLLNFPRINNNETINPKLKTKTKKIFKRSGRDRTEMYISLNVSLYI